MPALAATVARRTLTMGIRHLDRRDLEELREAVRSTELRVLGWPSPTTSTRSWRWPRSPRSRCSALFGSRAVQVALGPRTV